MPIAYGTVLITGANSFYAAAIMDRLVPLGIRIHGTVRSETAVSPLKRRYGDMIRIFVTPNICLLDAFMEAVHGCDGIFHVASPFRPNFKDAKTEVLDPAIKGTLAALNAAARTVSVKRVVMTSSVAAVINQMHELGFHRPGYTYTEADWNPVTYEEASESQNFHAVYTASKALAEKAAWAFMEDQSRHFDLVTINPCQTWGTYGQNIRSTEAMNFSNSDLSRLIDGKEKSVPNCQMPWVTDINAVADAHVAALLTPEARGRYLVATASLDFQEVVDIMHSNFPQAEWIRNVPKGQPGVRQPKDFFALDNTRSQHELRVRYRSVENIVIDFCKQYQDHRKALAKL
ncbi:hypothetical protein BDV23DRAFT_193347 [Aspergillus alliaceus]|uniref:NAD-dependent epimerase/dehydratase domain-containing protein n=1 Tax=Petromyces alliaceus TaxID=209559 RepID=A0A5N7CAG9_PETAA|nr:hypothetical protein BDV23DRAFT_193347 [Aspergillus alliaceus]